MSGHVDCWVQHEWGSQEEVIAYLPPLWREYVGERGSMPWGLGGKEVRLELPYRSPILDGPGHPTALSEGDLAASCSYDGMAALLAGTGARAAVLTHGDGLLFAADNNVQLGRELCAASNRWTAERWLEPAGSPFLASLLVPNHSPEAAAAEIRRYSGHPRIAMVAMGGNGLGKPFGHPIYHPIYEAAAEADLPVALHSAADGLIDTIAHATAGGLPSFYGEFRALAAQSLMTHVTSIICQGLFDKYPGLRVVVVGGGVAWVPALVWRLDTNYGPFGRDAPWLTRSPSEYFAESIRVVTYRLERPAQPECLHRAARTMPELATVLCYGSGLPAADADSVDDARQLLPADWHDAVFAENAAALLGSRLATHVINNGGAC